MRENYIIGIIPEAWRLELTRYPWVRDIFKSRWMPLALIIANMFMFTVILMAGFFGGVSAGNYNFGIMIVWIVWWVVLMMVLVPFMSRFWCTMCPLPSLGEWLQRLKIFGVRPAHKMFGLNKRWPKSLSNMWLMNVLFLGTTFTTGFITTRPVATFIMMSVIILAGIVLSMIYRQRAFCLYVCPVSGFQGLYANFATVEVRVKDADICAKHKTKGCVTGNEQGFGCPWMLLPYKFERNTYCGMCFECLKTCEYDNMAINLRPPGTDLMVDKSRGLDESWKSFIMLGISMVFFLVMQGPWGVLKDWANGETLAGWLGFVALHTGFNFALLPAIFFGFVWAGHRSAAADEVSLKKSFVNFSYSTVPLGLAAWIAFSFGILLPNGSYVLHILSDPFAWGWDLFGTAHFPWTPVFTGVMPILQIASMLIGLLFSLDFAVKLGRQTYGKGEAALRASLPVMGFLTLTTIVMLWLFIG
jgi:hypothetical protein